MMYMGFGGLLNQLATTTAGGGMGAVVENYPVASGYSVSAGDVVDVSGGQVVKTVTAEANTENVIINGQIFRTAVCALNDQYSVLLFARPSSSNNSLQVVMIKNADGGIVYGPATLNNNQEPSNISIARLSDTQFVVSYTVGGVSYARAGTVSGTAVSFGTQEIVYNGASDSVIVSLTANLAFSVNGNSSVTEGLIGRILTISGASIIEKSSTVSAPEHPRANYLSVTLLPDDSSGNHRVCVCFSDSGDSNKGKAVIATISADNTVTWGTVVTIYEEDSGGSVCCTATKDYIFAVCRENVYVLGYDLSVKASRALSPQYAGSSPSQESLCSDGTGNSALFTYLGRETGSSSPFSAARYIRYDEIKGIQWGELYPYNDGYDAGTSASVISSAAISNGRYILAYADSRNSSYGTTTILEVMGNQIAGSFTDGSSTAIALQSGTAGQTIPVCYSGIVKAPFVSQGDVISSSGVTGVGILDGVLQVYAKDAPGKIVTGSYTGIYNNNIPSTNHQKINLGYEPKIVFILNSSSNVGYIIINCDYVQDLSTFNIDVPTRGFGIQFNTTASAYLTTYSEGFIVCSDDANVLNNIYYYSALI